MNHDNELEREMLIRRIEEKINKMTIKELEALEYHLSTQSLIYEDM